MPTISPADLANRMRDLADFIEKSTPNDSKVRITRWDANKQNYGSSQAATVSINFIINQKNETS